MTTGGGVSRPEAEGFIRVFAKTGVPAMKRCERQSYCCVFHLVTSKESAPHEQG